MAGKSNVLNPVTSMFAAAARALDAAADNPVPAGRYVGAHLAALRAAAAVVAARTQPDRGRASRRRLPRSMWELLADAEPSLAEWATYFAAGAHKRAAAEAGLPRAVSGREADELVRDAGVFLGAARAAARQMLVEQRQVPARAAPPGAIGLGEKGRAVAGLLESAPVQDGWVSVEAMLTQEWARTRIPHTTVPALRNTLQALRKRGLVELRVDRRQLYARHVYWS
jgi:hypothetical protein